MGVADTDLKLSVNVGCLLCLFSDSALAHTGIETNNAVRKKRNILKFLV